MHSHWHSALIMLVLATVIRMTSAWCSAAASVKREIVATFSCTVAAIQI